MFTTLKTIIQERQARIRYQQRQNLIATMGLQYALKYPDELANLKARAERIGCTVHFNYEVLQYEVWG